MAPINQYLIADHEALMKRLNGLLNQNGLFFTEDITRRISLNDYELREIEKEIYGKHLPLYDEYITNLESNGFKLILAEDMSESWTDFTKKRITQYHIDKERNIRIHNKEIVESLSTFYNFVGQYFSSGKLGGIRVIAKKT